MDFFVRSFQRLKWGIFPTRRIVDEDVSEDVSEEVISKDSTNIEESEKKSISKVEVNELSFEYRDEANRPWWKFFDEYEYRITSQFKSNRKWYKWFHDEDTPEERKLILKIDLLLTFYSLMAYWVKYLDQTNLTNAYVGGMKESINMQGNDFVNTQVMFNIGNIIFQIPFMYVLYALPLNYVMPSLDICWSILTICLSQVKSVGTLKTLRFFIGAFEAPSYIAYHSLFASWYRGSTGEIARRAGFYYFGQYLGILTSGVLSGAIERGMKDVGGYEAWQWIFIIDGIISLIVGIIGIYMIPGTPHDCYSIFLSDEDIRIARKRIIKDNKDVKPKENATKYFFDFTIWKDIFTSWQFYVLSIWDIFLWNNSNGTSGAYALWLKSLTKSDGITPLYNAGKLQDMTALTPGLGIIWLIIVCSIADFGKSRSGAIIFSQIFNILCNVLLAIWNLPQGTLLFAFCLQYFSWSSSPVLYSWQGDICRRDIRKRQVILVIMNMIGQQSTAWIAVLVWKTVESPRFLKGYSFTAASAFALIIWTLVVLYFYKRDEKLHAKENGIIIYNSKNDKESIEST
ncbi:unnamed protein product [Candida verbasci]|uniref:Transporter SEO1 n=1 Tax=Candida verbasci TaxID=1227364 RepID=A0A9W4U262_9ASCO|nr:unnamed protein product [Candida verbasci]